MSTSNLPTSRRIEMAHAKRARRRTGVLRVKIIGGVFAVAFAVGLIGGILTPGA